MSDGYSEEEFQTALTIVGGWNEAFVKSLEFASLSDSHQRETWRVTEAFARHAYEYLGLRPAEWDRRAVVECCTNILPRKISAEAAFFKAIAPVLSAFFGFLESQSFLPNGRELARVVEKLNAEIVANSEDRNAWGPAKRFVMAAYDAGVDVCDQAALTAFMLQFNLQQIARSRFAGDVLAPSPFAGAPEPMPKEPKFPPPPSRYNPCPCGSGKKYKFCCEPKG